MGIQGLLSYCLERREQCVVYHDLIDIARQRDGIEILCDFYSFEHFILRNFWNSLEGVSGNRFIRLLGGEYKSLDAYISKLVLDLQSLGIKLVMFIDGAKGSSKKVTEQKLQTWKFRHEKDVEKLKELTQVYNGTKQIEELPDTTSVRPVLLEIQIISSLRNCNCEIVQLPAGEADYALARNLTLRPKAFAIVSNDSDFCVFHNSQFIPNELFDIHKDLQLGQPHKVPEKPIRLVCAIISSEKVISMLQLEDREQLVELSIVAGNDFTGHHMRKLRSQMGFRGRPMLTDFVNFIKQYRKIENHPAVMKEISANRFLNDSIGASRQFYNLTLDSEDNEIKGPLSQLILDQIRIGNYPSNLYSMHRNFYWHRMMMEDVTHGHPCAEEALSELRSFIYKMVLDRREYTVVEYGRTRYRLLDTYQVNVAKDRRIRTVDYMEREKRFQNLRTFHMAMTHLEPNFPTEWYKRYGWKNGCICYCLRYFLVMNTGANLGISLDEFLPLVAMVHCQVDEEWYQSLCLLPTLRCTTVGSWFQDVFRHAFQFLGNLLNLTDEFPSPRQMFKGAVWTAFYMVKVHERMLLDVAHFPEEYTRRINTDMRTILKEKQHIIKYIVEGIHDLNQRY